jgi:hypothetical protein
MKNNRLDHIILYIIIVSFILAIAALARLFAAIKGFDNFSLFIIFIIAVAIQAVIYLSIHSFLDRLMLPVIGKLLAKIPFVRRKIEGREEEEIYGVEYVEIPEQIMLIEAKEKTEYVEADEEEEVQASLEEDNIDEQAEIITLQAASFEEIRQEQLQKRATVQEEKLNTAMEYTRKTFVLYISEENLEVLLQNLQVYINNLDVKELKSIKIKELTINDLRHFGWNIWNHFRPRNQMDIAHFLKVVFSDVFKDAEIDSIKRHLKDDELKGIIKIQERIYSE